MVCISKSYRDVFVLSDVVQTDFENRLHAYGSGTARCVIEMDERNHMGRKKDGAVIPAAPSLANLDESYLTFISQLKRDISETRIRILLDANTRMNALYWRIGKHILDAQNEKGWGAKVIDRISHDLRVAFPDMKGFSATNLKYMRRYAQEFPDQIGQQPVDRLPWGSVIVLLTKLDSNEQRIWYAQRAIEGGWGRNVLAMQIDAKLIDREGRAVTNFKQALPSADSDMAQQMFKDPYLFDFLGTADTRRELEIERALTEHIQDFLLELGRGFAFVGRQVPLEVDGQTFYLDMLFYHLELRCYVVIELKACEFKPGFVSQLNMYRNVVDDLMRHPEDNKTIGLLLVRGKSDMVVRYSLDGYEGPIGVADWRRQLEKELPEDIKSSLPTIEELESELDADLGFGE